MKRISTVTLLDSCKTFALLGCCLAAAIVLADRPASAQTADVLKTHNDLANTGQNLQETLLTPALLRSGRFGLQFRIPVDPEEGPNIPHNLSGAEIYAQPLYLAGVPIPGGARRNILFVATEHDSVYAFDADTGAKIWRRILVKSQPFPGNSDLQPEIGITGTPVIDPTTGTLYFVALTMDNDGSSPSDFHQRLYALDCATGADKFAPGFPVEVTASAIGTEGRPDAGPITFRADLQNQRCGLTLNAGNVYIAWASFRDQGPYHGWLISYDAHTGANKATLNIAPDASRDGAGIWQSGGAPAIDAAGNVYVTTGNGLFDSPTGNWGESFLRLDGSTLEVKDFFTPYNHVRLDAGDADLGAGGMLLLPDSVGSPQHSHLMFSGGKTGILYLDDRDAMGKFDPLKNDVVQEIEVPVTGDSASSKRTYGLYSVHSYFNGAVYFLRTGEYIKRVPIANAKLDESQSVANTTQRFGFPGASPSISANGSEDGIVWATESYDPAGLNMQDHADPQHMRLHAYDATTLEELYDSGDTAPTIDGVVYRNFMKFNPPTVTNGHVYIATGGSILVYGVTSPALGTDVTAQVQFRRSKIKIDKATGKISQTVTLTNTGKTDLIGPVSLAFEDLSAGVRLSLDNGSGNGATSSSMPSGVFYHNFSTLAPKQTVSAVLTFLPFSPNGQKVTHVDYTPRILAGGETR
jgi:hypothetical protein